MFRNEHAFDPWISQYSAQFSVPMWVIQTTIGKESSFDPKAFDGDARGLMQLEEPTARDLGLRGSVGDDQTHEGGLYEPQLSIQLGTKYLAQLAARYPGMTWDRIYSAYNVGHYAPGEDGTLPDQTNVDEWGAIADYFNPAWRDAVELTGGPTRPRTE